MTGGDGVAGPGALDEGGNSRKPYLKYWSSARGSQFLKALLLRNDASASLREAQVSGRRVLNRAALGPDGPSSWITGSIKARLWNRRGWISERCTLRHGQPFNSRHDLYADVQLRCTQAVTDANDWARHVVPEVVHHTEQVAGVVEPIG